MGLGRREHGGRPATRLHYGSTRPCYIRLSAMRHACSCRWRHRQPDFGDEPGFGTAAEDAVSLVAACSAAGDGRTLLAALGFGIDHFHGVSHHASLENVARMCREGGYLGGVSLVNGPAKADAFLDLVAHAKLRQPDYPGVVCKITAGHPLQYSRKPQADGPVLHHVSSRLTCATPLPFDPHA